MVQPQTDLVRHWPHFSKCGKSYFVPYKDSCLARSCFSPSPTINLVVVGPNNKYKKVSLFMQADVFKLCHTSTSKFTFVSTLGDWYFCNHSNLHCRSSIWSRTRRLRGESSIGHYGYYRYKVFDSNHRECEEGIFGTGVYFRVVQVPHLLLDLMHPDGSLRISSCHASAIKFTFPVRSRSCVGTEVYFGVVRVPHLLLDLMNPNGSLGISSCHASAIKLTFPVRSRSCVGTEVYFRVVWVPCILLDLMHPDGSLRISSCHTSAIKLTFPVSRSCVGTEVYFRVVWVPCLLLDLMHPDGSLGISSCHASAIIFTFPVRSRSCVILFHCDLLLYKHKRKIFGWVTHWTQNLLVKCVLISML